LFSDAFTISMPITPGVLLIAISLLSVVCVSSVNVPPGSHESRFLGLITLSDSDSSHFSLSAFTFDSSNPVVIANFSGATYLLPGVFVYDHANLVRFVTIDLTSSTNYLVTVSASTGQVKSQWSYDSPIAGLEFDNHTGELFAVTILNGYTVLALVSTVNGALNPVASIGPEKTMAPLPGSSTYAQSNRTVYFVVGDASNPQLVSVNANTFAVHSAPFGGHHPYSLIFDDTDAALYALVEAPSGLGASFVQVNRTSGAVEFSVATYPQLLGGLGCAYDASQKLCYSALQDLTFSTSTVASTNVLTGATQLLPTTFFAQAFEAI